MPLKLSSLLFFFTCLTVMASDISGNAILRQVADTYRALKSERVEATVVMNIKSSRIETPIVGVIARPGRVRFEIINSMIGSQTISDGRSVWKYVGSFGQYTKKAASPGLLPIPDPLSDIFLGENISKHLGSAKLLRREELLVDGQQVNCYVIEASYTSEPGSSGSSPTSTFWVDIHRNLILKVSSFIRLYTSEAVGTQQIARSITVTSIGTNEPIRDSAFNFVPPEGTKEVAELRPTDGKSLNRPTIDVRPGVR